MKPISVRSLAIIVAVTVLLTLTAHNSIRVSAENETGMANAGNASQSWLASLLEMVLGKQESGASIGMLPQNGKIAFYSNRTGNVYEIYTMNADGTSIQQLTSNGTGNYYPAWSPDGSRIAWRNDGQGTSNGEIWTMNADGTNQTRITFANGNDEIPNWSPDGSKILFGSQRDAGNAEIYVMNADGSNQTRLTNNSFADYYASFSPDGSKIVFNSNRDGNDEIYVMNADGSNPQRLTNHAAYDLHPSFSPDGTRILFRSEHNGNAEIWIMNADGTNPLNLSSNAAFDNDPAWSPDGSKIAFRSNRDGNGELYTMNADGSGQSRVTTIAADDQYPVWQPVNATPFLNINNVTVAEPTSGTITATFTVSLSWATNNIVFVDVATANNTAIAPGDYASLPTTQLMFNSGETTKQVQVTINSDNAAEALETFFVNLSNATNAAITDAQGIGTIQQRDFYAKIAFNSNRDGNVEIYQTNSDGSSPSRLTNTAGSDDAPAWSPDGKKIAFNSERSGGGNFEIYVMDAEGGFPTRLTNNSAGDYYPEWSPDGSKIVFQSNRDGNQEIYVMNADGSSQTRLTNNSAVDALPAWSPDGSRIVFRSNRDGNDEIYTMSVSGASVVRLTNNNVYDTDPTFSPDGTKIAFRSDRSGNAEIWTMNADSSNPVNLTNNSAAEGSCSWSLDGSTILFVSTRDGNSEIYMMNADGSAQTRLTNNNASDDSPVFQPVSISVMELNVVEPWNSFESFAPPYSILLSRPSAQTITVDVSTADNTAVSPDDYIAVPPMTVTFNPGETIKQFPVTIKGDDLVEPEETFFINLSNATNANLPKVQFAKSIFSDDCAQPPAGLAAFYKADNNANDSANTNHGSMQNGAGFAAGKVGQSFNLDGADDYVSIPDSASVSVTGQLSLAAWIKTDTLSHTNTFITKYDSQADQHSFFFGTNGANGRVQFTVYANNTGTIYRGVVTNNNAIAANVFSHVAATFNPQTQEIKVYVNGAEVPATLQPGSSTVSSIFDSSTAVRIGTYVNGAGSAIDLFDGLIDEMQIYNRALSASEIQAIAASDILGVCALPSTVQFSAANYSTNENGGTVTVTVTRTGDTSNGSAVDYAVSNATATAGVDFTATNGRLNFASGEANSKTFTISILDDPIYEGNETVNLTLSNPSSAASLGTPSTAILTINDNEAQPVISINDVTIAEPVIATVTASFNVILSNASAQTITVEVATANNTATAPADYNALPTTQLSFAPGETTKQVQVTINSDNVTEALETFFINLSNAVNATISDNQGIGTIRQQIDNGKIAFASDRTGNEEIFTMNADGSGQTNVSNHSSQDGQPAWSPDGSAIAFKSSRNGLGDIYTMNADGTIQTRLTTATGSDEVPSWSPDGSKIAFYSTRDTGGGGEIYVMNADGTNQTRLTNNTVLDYAPKWSPDGNKIVFQSRRDVATHEIYVMNADGTNPVRLTNNAVNDQFPAFSPDGSKIAFYSDRTGNDEIFVMNADGSNQTNISNNAAFDNNPSWSPDGAKIIFYTNRDGNREIYTMNADGSSPTNLSNNAAFDYFPSWQSVAASPGILQFSGAAYSVNENVGAATITVTRTGSTSSAGAVNYATSNNTATAGSDFAAASGTLNFAAGEASKTFTVSILDDTIYEGNETVNLTLSNPTGGATLGVQNTATLTIIDNEAQPTISINDVTTAEPTSATATATFIVSLNNASTQTVTVNAATASNTAIAPADYVALATTGLTFAPGETTKQFQVTINSDNVTEALETFFVNLSNAANATIADNQGIGTIRQQAGNGRLAFHSQHPGNWEIFTMNPDGSGQINVSNNISTDFNGKWSPDGSKIVFSSSRDGNYEIYVMNADGSNQTRLTMQSTSDDMPAWSPDGSKIVFSSSRDGNYEIYVMNADGSNQTRLTNNSGTDYMPEFSPEGSRIAFHSQRTGNWEIYVMNSDGASQMNLTNNPAADLEPSWSPDGSKIAFRSERSGSPNIWVMNANGTNPVNLSNIAGIHYQPSFSPDGSKIAFSSFRNSGNFDIYVMNASDGGNQTRLTTDANIEEYPSWQPVGNTFSLSVNDVTVSEPSSDTTTATFIVSLSPISAQTVTVDVATANGTATAPADYDAIPTTTLTFNPGETSKIVNVTVNSDSITELLETFSINLSNAANATITDSQGIGTIRSQFTNNGRIVFRSNRDGNNEIYSMNADGTDARRLTTNTADDFEPGVSPDGAKIVFGSNRDSDYEIFVMNADGSNQINLTTNTFNDYYPNFSPDNSRIVFASNRDGNDEIYVMNTDGTNATRLTTNNGSDYNPSFSPDGSKIVFASNRDNGQHEIYIMNSDGSAQTRLTNNNAADYDATFSTDGSKIAFSSFRDGNFNVYVMNSDGSSQTPFTTDGATDEYPAFSPDGSKIAFVSTRHGNYELYSANTDGSNVIRLTTNNIEDYAPAWQPAVISTYSISGQVTNAGNGLSGVSVALSGSAINQTTTDSNGNYSFSVNSGGSYTVTPSLTNYTFNPAISTFSNLSANQTANFAATSTCSYSINPTSADVTATGGTGSVQVTAQTGCAWTAVSNAGWLAVTSGATGSGNGAVGYSFTANTGASRSGTIAIANQTFTVAQAATAPVIGGSVTANGAPVAGAFVRLSGSASSMTTTDAGGNYSFANLTAGGSYVITVSKDRYVFDPANKAVNNLQANQTMNFTGAPLCAAPPSGLAAWFKAEDNANDSTGSNHGSMQNGADFGAGKVDKAFSLDGANDFVLIPNSPPVRITGALSISTWINPGNLSPDKSLVTKFSSQNNDVSFFFGTYNSDGSRIRFSVYQTGNASVKRGIVTNNAVLTAGVWHHVTVTFNPANQEMKIYVNGAEVPSVLIPGENNTVTSIYDSATAVRIGTHIAGSGTTEGFFHGYIDETQIYNRALSASEISAINQSGSAGVCTSNAFLTSGAANGKIAFVSTRTGNYEIFTMNSDGMNQTNVSNNAAIDSDPAFSPDGSRIAFRSYRNNNADIYVMNADGSNQIRLTTDAANDYMPSWSPDGTKIVFYSNRTGGGDIYLMNSDGTNQTRLTTNASGDYAPKFSPDGSRIVFYSGRDGNFEIYVMNADGSNQTNLTNNSAGDQFPSFSPDGAKIAFGSSRTGNWEIFVMNADGSNPINLSNNSAVEWNAPAWSRDGTEIAFDTNRDGSYEIYVMNANGGGQTRLTNNTTDDNYPAWQRVGFVPASSVKVLPASNLNLTFNQINVAGYTVATPLTVSQVPLLPAGYGLRSGTAYEIRTSAQYTGDITVRLTVPNVLDAATCANLTVLHHVGGNWDAANNGFPTFNAGVCTVQQIVTSLSPFVVAEQVAGAQGTSLSGNVVYGTTPAGQNAKFVSGVTLTAAGATNAVVNSGAAGAYLFNNLTINDNYVVTPTKTGQVNGITAFDATLILRCVAAGANCALTSNQRKAADADSDNNVTAFDATQILRFVAANGQNANTGQIGKWKFNPVSESYASIFSSLAGENYTAFLIGEIDGDWAP